MKRILIAILAAGLLSSYAFGQARTTRSFTDLVTGGSLVVTNDFDESNAYELKRVEFVVPSAAFTNTFTLTQNRKFMLDDTSYDLVETNLVSSEVTTNAIYYTGGSATFAHTNTIAVTTNDVGVQIYDGDNFGWGLTFEFGDVATFGFTYTNTLYLIRVYDTYPRP